MSETVTTTEEKQFENFELPVKRVEGDTVEDRLTENAHDRILPARYLLKDEDGEVIETPEEMFERVAKNVAQPAKEYEYRDYEEEWKRFYSLMTNLEFMPNSPTLMNAGTDLQQLSACFVVHPEDDMDSIFESVHDAANIFQTGGGVGYPFHLMRPKGDPVASTGGIASGPLTFQQVFDTMCGTIKQGGKRRGAQMGIMRVDHPDVLRFIVSKRKEGKFSNFNISVGLTDEFMEAVQEDDYYTLINPRDGEPHKVTEKTAEFYNNDEKWHPEEEGSDQGRDDNFWRDFADTFSGEMEEYDIDLEPGDTMELPARLIWDALIDGAWRNGEPGLYAYDTSNQMHSFDVEKHPEHRMEATNPCAEQPLENYEACNLGHINLSLLVEDQGDGKGLNWHDWKEEHDYDYEEELDEAMQEFLEQALRMEKFEEVAKTATRFLDNVATMSDFPLEEIEEKVSEMRKIGLGLMGLAQMLIQLGIRYGSDESQAASKEIQRLISKWAVESSHQLAKERGVFKEWEKSKWSSPTEYPEWFREYTGGKDPEDWEGGMELRNHKHTTIAPTGTTSMIANTSGGCEPIYSLAYFKNVAKDIQGEDMLVEFDDYFLKALEANDVGIEEVKENAEELMRNNEWEGVQSVPDDVLPPEMKELFTTADRVEPREHVDVQAALQEHNHSGISKTINFPNDASREDVSEAYMRAYKNGIKGMTVYRDGARDVQVMTTREDNKLEDLDKADMISQLVDEFGSTEEFLTSQEFREAAGLKEEAGMVVKKNGDGSYETQTIEPGEEPGAEKEGVRREPRERPEIITGTTQKIDTGYGGMYVTINEDENGIFEVFLQLGKSGGYTQSFTDALGRLVSTALRAGIDEEEVIEQLEGIRSPKVAWDNSEQILSVPDGVAKAMERYLSGEASAAQTSVTNFADEEQEKEEVDREPKSTESQSDTSKMIGRGMNPECPECGGMLQLQEGCKTCPECGWSECE
ncbi:MAG: adenosylcobalamin-dependent ribonucleoside-diphosphate reductase [Candidatus Nanohaloarchaeota archaeon QJJ-7]|nr:adenosylcobalamin-dependent ribonucleoside-diphosphate reductase [Candidatus Nanohaloarchaeota archaeon QJJ-7]